ncbi:MAG: hypothetical protein ABIQ27_06160 [Flavobacterium sp.]|uniref:hypothetical protein n=1 Tax=Flavobacterium sp. TaxID=239 RepID=UPI00326604FC
MSRILIIKASASTEKEPLNFFEIFFSSHALENAKKLFYPDPNNFNDIRNNPPVEIDTEKESYTIEYEEILNEEESHLDNFFPLTEKKTKTYFFEEELNKRLREEFYISTKLINENIINSLNKYKAKYFFEKIINDCLFLFDQINQNEKFHKYADCKRPVNAIIRFVYKKHNWLAPKFSVFGEKSNFIIDLLNEVEAEENNYSEPPMLKGGIAKEIFELRDQQTDELIFELENFNNDRIIDLKSFIYNQFDKITAPINFISNIEAAHYLLRCIIDNSELTIPRVQKSGKILVNGKLFDSDNHNTNVSRFKSKNNPLKPIIDQIIDNSLQS